MVEMENFILDQFDIVQIIDFVTYHKFLVAAALIATAIYFSNRSKRIFLIDFICHRSPDNSRAPLSTYLEHAELMNKFSPETLEFQKKVVERSGIGNETYVPIGMHTIPADHSHNSTMEEVEAVFFSVVENLFTKHKINPKSIDILVTNCSVVCPTPSLAAIIINKFGFRSNVMSYNLSGMGCSAGMLSISLVTSLLRVHKNSLALVLSMESICSNLYFGNNKSMLVANCLFRMGGAAILLSNRPQDKEIAKYELQHIVQTHLGSKDGAYKCVVQDVDDEGQVGVSLSRTLLQFAGEALKTNMATLGPLVLPYSEQIKFTLSSAWKKIWPPSRKRGIYVPDFKKSFDHFCIHAGGKTVINVIKERLILKDRDVEASKMTLYRFGNTSSSSTWYSLSYLEAKGRMKRGDRVWQLSFGSGFKCNSVVWKCISKIELENSNVWFDRIHRYPVEMPELISFL